MSKNGLKRKLQNLGGRQGAPFFWFLFFVFWGFFGKSSKLNIFDLEVTV